MRRTAPILAFLIVLAVCAPADARRSAPATATAPHAISGLSVIPLTIIHGKVAHRFRVEVAKTEDEQEKGLMFRKAMRADEGMIFPMTPPRMAAFWMRNTVLPLDIIFIGPNHRVLNLAANAVPYSDTPLPSVGPVSAVLELNGGRAAALGIKPGDLVRW